MFGSRHENSIGGYGQTTLLPPYHL